MATFTIPGTTAATTIDAVNDYLLIYNNSATAYRKINRNVLLSITGNPVGTTDTQTLSSKTLTAPTINGGTLSGTFSGTYTLGGTPTFPSSVVTLTGTQTLTNKTLTNPVITGGTYDNGTITVDSISGHTTSTIVTVGGVQMNNGVIGTTGAVTTNSIAPGAVVPNSLVAASGTGWSWQSFTTTFTGITVGNGTLSARYVQTGKYVTFRLDLQFGTTTAVTGSVSFTLPVTTATYPSAQIAPLGEARMLHSGVTATPGAIFFNTTTTALLQYYSVTSATGPLAYGSLSSSLPFTWGNLDVISILGFYEAA